VAARGEREGSTAEARTPVRITYLVKQLELAIRQNIDRSVRRYGLTTPQYTALTALARHPGMSSAELARQSFVTPQAANEMVAALQRKGLIERHADVHNQRVLEMYLTDVGGQTLEICTTEVLELESEMLAGFTIEAQSNLRALLEACLGAVSGEPGRRDLVSWTAS
jgi:DNA-binding MarR family transcriptional regulator